MKGAASITEFPPSPQPSPEGRGSWPFLLLILLCLLGCTSKSQPEVVVYAALDREFSEPVLREFEAQEKVVIRAKYDIESTKTIGLVTTIIQEQNRPRCDVFWNNEILHTMRLEKLGLLAPFEFPGSDKWPAEFRSPSGTWYGMAARARVIIVNTKLVKAEDRPHSIRDLADARWKDRCGLAKPLFGTTATHAAVLFAAWGEDDAKAFFHDVRGNAQVLSGNKQVALAVASGQLAWGVTDTDDAIIEKDAGRPVEIIFPDQGEDEPGVLMIPNSVVLIKDAPHAAEAQRLLIYLYDEKHNVEAQLASGPSAQFPINPAVKTGPRVAPKAALKIMKADFAAAAEQWDSAAQFLKSEFAAAP
jgi:iron(III) transport system substrate-binding protein